MERFSLDIFYCSNEIWTAMMIRIGKTNGNIPLSNVCLRAPIAIHSSRTVNRWNLMMMTAAMMTEGKQKRKIAERKRKKGRSRGRRNRNGFGLFSSHMRRCSRKTGTENERIMYNSGGRSPPLGNRLLRAAHDWARVHKNECGKRTNIRTQLQSDFLRSGGQLHVRFHIGRRKYARFLSSDSRHSLRC